MAYDTGKRLICLHKIRHISTGQALSLLYTPFPNTSPHISESNLTLSLLDTQVDPHAGIVIGIMDYDEAFVTTARSSVGAIAISIPLSAMFIP
jgi:hypothetical protein